MKYCNQSTNKFETLVGMLNIAPTKISGQYKLVYDKNLKPWLDDYTGRRVALDTSTSFLQQVSNFLSVSTFLTDNTNLRFGGFQRNKIKSWHIPFYFSKQLEEKDFPKYFVLSQVPNENYDKEYFDNIYKFGILIKAIDLKNIGLYNILKEINSEPYFNYPLYFNHEERKVQLFGFGIEQQYPCQYTLNLTEAYANQTYIDVINNKILNAYATQKIFFPRFLNIEFEFDFDTLTIQDFNNFYGYLSNSEIQENNLPTKNITKENNIHNGYFIKFRSDKFVYYKEDQLSSYILDDDDYPKLDDIILKPYSYVTNTGSVNEISERNPQVRFKLSHINVNDIFRIKDANDNILFEYQVTYEDTTFDTLYQMMIHICKKMTVKANLDYEFSCKQLPNDNCIITVISNVFINDDLNQTVFDITTKLELPVHAQAIDFVQIDNIVDYNFVFRGIGQNDVWLCGNQSLCENEKYLIINDIEYQIIETFLFDDYLICRLVQKDEIEFWESKHYDKITPVNITKLTTAVIKKEEREICLKLEPINFLSYYNNCESSVQGNFAQYINDLKNNKWKHFDEKAQTYFKQALEDFSGLEYDEIGSVTNEKIKYQNKILNQYVKNDSISNNLINSVVIDIEYHNELIVKNILFASMGYTGYMSPNVLNIDRQFWIQNGCLDVNKSHYDLLRYTWFLIAEGEPSYLKGDWRYMDCQYFDNEGNEVTENDKYSTKVFWPRITSRLIKITDKLCETIFLGVKYQLPIQYENYQFCVYLNYNDSEYIQQSEYYIEVREKEKLLLLSINKFLDFSDLIRGGDTNNQPILDLSFFNNIKTSYNNCSDYYIDFKTIDINTNDKKLLLEPFYTKKSDIYFKGKQVDKWIQEYNGIKYFCLQGVSRDLRVDFRNDEDKTIYITAKITYQEKEYTYNSVKFIFEGITQVHENYLWFTDLKVIFFDNKDLFLQNPEFEVLKIQFDNINGTNILAYEDVKDAEKDAVFKDYHKIVSIIEDSRQQFFELLLPSEIDNDGKRVARPISLLHDWYRVSKERKSDNNDGSLNPFKFTFEPELESIKENQVLTNYLLGLKNELEQDISVYDGSYTLFDRNQIWYIIQYLLTENIKFKNYTEKQIQEEFEKFSVEHFLNLPSNSIKIKNVKNLEFSDTYIVVNAFNIDKNYVIWDVNFEHKVIKINRFNAPYLPLLTLEPNIEKFQIANYQVNNTLFNLYDKAFGGFINNDKNFPISGTTLWQEVQGNLISTLFCKYDDIILTAAYPLIQEEGINYFELLKTVIDYNKIIVTNDNRNYIETLNKNLKPYIIETYAELLTKFYKLESVSTNTGLRLPYTIDNQNNYIVYVPDKYSLGVRYQNVNSVVIKLVRI